MLPEQKFNHTVRILIFELLQPFGVTSSTSFGKRGKQGKEKAFIHQELSIGWGVAFTLFHLFNDQKVTCDIELV